MSRLRVLIVLLLSLATVPAFAQRAVIIQLPNGTHVGIAYTTTGQIILTDITVIKLEPTPNPTPPPPITSGTVGVIVIRVVDTLTADQSRTLSDLRQWSDQQPTDKVSHLEFPPDAVGPDGEPDKKVAAFVAKIPATSRQPYVFITQPRADGKSVILWQSDLPNSAATVIAKAKEFIK